MPDGIGTLVPVLRRYAPVTAKGRAQRLGLGRAQAIWPWGTSRRSTGESDDSDELLVLSDQGHVGARVWRMVKGGDGMDARTPQRRWPW